MKRFLLLVVLLIALVGVVSADTLIVYPAAITDDASIFSIGDNVTFDALHTAPTGTVIDGTSNYAYALSGRTADRYYRMYRAALIFNTSAIPDDAIISAANIGLYDNAEYVGLGNIGIGVTRFNIDGSIDAGDFNNFDYDRFADDKLLGAITLNKYNNWSLNAIGLSNISKTGLSGFGVLTSNDIDNSAPVWASYSSSGLLFNSANAASNFPFVEIAYTAPDITPPSSITSLTNSTPTCNRIDWQWVNPTNPEYNGLGILQNGTWANVTNTSTSASWTGLPNGTVMMFNSTTFDLSDNQNLTHWQNASATTEDFCVDNPRTHPQIWNWYCPSGRFCLGPFVLWAPSMEILQ